MSGVEFVEGREISRLLTATIPFLVRGRSWDLVHTVDSVKQVGSIVESAAMGGLLGEDRVMETRRLVTAAVMLHDSGNSKVNQLGANWVRPESRIKHMREGTKITRSVLGQVAGYTEEDIETVCLLVGTHDAEYLKDKDISGIEGVKEWQEWWDKVQGDSGLYNLWLLVREADWLWPMHADSFWKDVHFEMGEKYNYQNAQGILDRGAKFYMMVTNYGRKVVQQQIWDRQREVSVIAPHETYEQLLDKWRRTNEEAAANPERWVGQNLRI